MTPIPQIKLGMTAFKILGPIAVLIGVVIFHRVSVSNAYDRGADSRDIEVANLITERDTAIADKNIITGDLFRCRNTKAQAEADVSSLNSKMAAQADEHRAALKLQVDSFAATQRVTANAMSTLAKNIKVVDVDYDGILEQLKKEVNYEYDTNTGRCIIRGGGRVLSNAAKGKIGR